MDKQTFLRECWSRDLSFVSVLHHAQKYGFKVTNKEYNKVCYEEDTKMNRYFNCPTCNN